MPGAPTRVARDTGNYKRLFEIGIRVIHFNVHLIIDHLIIDLGATRSAHRSILVLEINPLT